MRQLFIFISFFIVCLSHSQPTTNTIITEETTWISGIFYRTVRDTIQLCEKPDLNFFIRHFNILYLLPDTLTVERYKGRTVKTWALADKKGDFTSNWLQTYTYDDKGRLKYFSYSGCVICSQFPFEYNILYKPTGEVDKIFDSKYQNRSYHFYYEKDKGLKIIEYFEDGTLSKRITRLI